MKIKHIYNSSLFIKVLTEAALAPAASSNVILLLQNGTSQKNSQYTANTFKYSK